MIIIDDWYLSYDDQDEILKGWKRIELLYIWQELISCKVSQLFVTPGDKWKEYISWSEGKKVNSDILWKLHK